MRPSQFKSVFGTGLTVGLFCVGVAISSNGAPPVALTAGQIFETMRQNYASLASYSDVGQILTTMDGMVVETKFTTRLARPGFYRIQWDQTSKSPDSTTDTGLVGAWSSGAGNFHQTGTGVRRLSDLDSALENLASSSGGAAANVPMIFFNRQASSSPGAVIGLESLPDDKIGNIECYTLTGELPSGETITFCIGKRDLLIHQIRTEASPKVMRAAWTGTGTTGDNLELAGTVHGFSSIETYTNIVVDQRFSRQDFVPSFPLFQPTLQTAHPDYQP